MAAQDFLPVGVRHPAEPVTVTVSRGQAWEIYDLLVSKARLLGAHEDEHLVGCGAHRYEQAASALRAQLDAPSASTLQHNEE